jgi:hypothetical protein
MLTVFLSASVPSLKRAERFRRGALAAFEIEQAVISLARAVFARGGRLVFGGHPSISPLVAMVAGEYRKPRRAENGKEREPASVIIYQSEAYRDVAEEATLLLYQMDTAQVVWTQAVGGERFDPERREGPQCQLSLESMRREMMNATQPEAMICIGGMEGVLEEARLYEALFPARKIYVLRVTGGAAAELAEAADSHVEVAETELLQDVARLRALSPAAEVGHSEKIKRRGDDEAPATPYPLIFQTLVAKLLGEGDHG